MRLATPTYHANGDSSGAARLTGLRRLAIGVPACQSSGATQPVRTTSASSSGVDMGAVVPFVLWFNFVAGFAYVLAGIGLWRGGRRAPMLALVIAVATVAVFAAFLWHVGAGGAWETRTMGAMILRTGVWIVIATLALRCKKAA